MDLEGDVRVRVEGLDAGLNDVEVGGLENEPSNELD
jgi:hypothetical protein